MCCAFRDLHSKRGNSTFSLVQSMEAFHIISLNCRTDFVLCSSVSDTQTTVASILFPAIVNQVFANTLALAASTLISALAVYGKVLYCAARPVVNLL